MTEVEKLAEEYLHNEIDIYEEIGMNDIKKAFLAGYKAEQGKISELERKCRMLQGRIDSQKERIKELRWMVEQGK